MVQQCKSCNHLWTHSAMGRFCLQGKQEETSQICGACLGCQAYSMESTDSPSGCWRGFVATSMIGTLILRHCIKNPKSGTLASQKRTLIGSWTKQPLVMGEEKGQSVESQNNYWVVSSVEPGDVVGLCQWKTSKKGGCPLEDPWQRPTKPFFISANTRVENGLLKGLRCNLWEIHTQPVD